MQNDMKRKQVQAIREAGHVSRLHTVPHHMDYRVNSHTWNLVSLIFLLHPDPSIYLIKAAQFHDCGERHAGDIPGHTKYWHDKFLGETHAKLEAKVMAAMGLGDLEDQLSYSEKRWLKGCDMLEFYMWCADELAMGNHHIQHVMSNVGRWAHQNRNQLPDEVMTFMNGYTWERTHDNGYWNDADEGQEKY